MSYDFVVTHQEITHILPDSHGLQTELQFMETNSFKCLGVAFGWV